MTKKIRKNKQVKTEKNPRAAGKPVNEKGKAKFLRVYPECGTVELAAKEVPVAPKTVYAWMKSDTDFATRVNDIKPVAKNTYLGALEQEAHRRAVEGVEEPVFFQGRLVAHVRKYSDTLLIVLLKANAPEKYRERTEITGKDGKALEVEIDVKDKLISAINCLASRSRQNKDDTESQQ